ncbi:MAG: metallophosphoesterase [Planctomycetes bacterium]|nr:metallophosphoesterase [Planctomycetota bacterium]
MTRLAHLSDIHLTAPNLEWTRADWFNKRLAAWANLRLLGRAKRFRHSERVIDRLMGELRQRSVEHIVFSGDATALGFASEMRRAAEFLQIAELPGLAVPGNHDYCTIPAARTGDFERVFAPWQQGRRVDGAIYPFAQRVGDAWLVAVNSCTGNRWAWDASGAAGLEQRQRLARLLETLPPGPRILVTHFPVSLASGKKERGYRGLRDLAELVDVAQRGNVTLWLHGHRHRAYYLPQPPHAPFPVVCAGSATQIGAWSYYEYTFKDAALTALRRHYNFDKNVFEDAESFQIQLT